MRSLISRALRRPKVSLLGLGLAVTVLSLMYIPMTAASQTALQENRAEIVRTVTRYATQWDPRQDPLVSLENGVEMKSSHLFGVQVGSERYYYRVKHGLNYDPVSRGEAKDYTVVAVIEPDTQWEVEVYRLSDRFALAGSQSLSSPNR